MIQTFIIVLLVITFIGTAVYYPVMFYLIRLLQTIGREEFIVCDNQDHSKRKEHAKRYWFCISPAEGKHYRFANNTAIDHYFCYAPGYAYLKWLLPERTNTDYEGYFFIRIPRNIEEAKEIQKWLSEKKVSVTLSDEDTEKLVQPNFDITAHMNFIQAWCWNNARVYVFQNFFFTIAPHFKEIYFSHPIPGPEGQAPEFEERREKSMNLVSKTFPYAKTIEGMEDVNNIPLGIDFVISGANENPWHSDVKIGDPFAQIDIAIRGAAVKVVSKFSYLAKSKNLDKTLAYFQNIIASVQEGKVPAPEKSADDDAEKDQETPVGKTARLAQFFQSEVLTELNSPENYSGFRWKSLSILDLYPSGSGAERIIQLQDDAVEAEIKAYADLIKLAESVAADFAENKVKDDDERKRIEREAVKFSREGEEKAKAINAIVVAEKKRVEEVITPLVTQLGKEGALTLLSNEKFFDALRETGSNVFLSTNSSNDLVNLGTKYLSDQNQKQKEEQK